MEDVEVRLREAQEVLSNYAGLVESLGWKQLMTVADGQLTNRLPSILAKTENFLELPGKEYEKGEVSGINLFMKLPEVVIEGLRAEIKHLEEQLGYDEAERTDGSDDTSGDDFAGGDAPRV